MWIKCIPLLPCAELTGAVCMFQRGLALMCWIRRLKNYKTEIIAVPLKSGHIKYKRENWKSDKEDGLHQTTCHNSEVGKVWQNKYHPFGLIMC